MTTQTISTLHTESEAQDSWVPMVAIALGQVLMSFNVASLPVAIGGMVASVQRAADHGGDGDRHVFACGRRSGHARREAVPALRRVARVSRGGPDLRRRDGADDVQPDRDRDDRGARLGRGGGSGARSLAGGAHRRQLQGAAAGHGAGRARLGARRRRRGGVPDRRHTRHLHRLAPGVRHSDRAGGRSCSG